MRFAELALFFAPLGAYVLWRVAATRGQPGPTPAVLTSILAGLVLCGAGLAWFAVSERGAPKSRYVPATFQNGQVVPGHDE